MSKLILEVGSTFININYNNVDSNNRFYIRRVIEEFCYKKLTTFDYIKKLARFIKDKTYFYHDDLHKCFKIPSMFLYQLKEYLDNSYIEYEINELLPVKTRAINIKFNDEEFPPRKVQIDAIDYLTNNNKQRSGLQLQTGAGKTYCAIKSLCNLNNITMIIVDGLVTQWYKSIKKYTDATDDNIYVIQGYESINKLFNSNLKPSIFICSIDTIRAYVLNKDNYESLPSYDEFLKEYEIGIKIVDEAHLNFHATCIIDLNTNVNKNIYITATFETSNSSVRKIFNTYFPDHMIYDDAEYDKYSNAYFYAYRGTVPERYCLTPKGYSHARYEGYLLKHNSLLLNHFYNIIEPIINMHWINKKYINKKAIIFFYRIDMVKHALEYLKHIYPHLNVVSYVTGDPITNLDIGEIILTTHKSAGVGKDIDNLRLCINTVSFQAYTLAKQSFGRLRNPKDGTTPEYVDIYDIMLRSHIRHFNERSSIIKSCAKQYFDYSL